MFSFPATYPFFSGVHVSSNTASPAHFKCPILSINPHVLLTMVIAEWEIVGFAGVTF